jgi:hypothetical protein
MKVCVSCRHRLGEGDLLDAPSRRMEAARATLGLRGVCFRYYCCPRCGHDHVFLEVAPLPGETPQDFRGRAEALTSAAREVGAVRTAVLVVEQGAPQE